MTGLKKFTRFSTAFVLAFVLIMTLSSCSGGNDEIDEALSVGNAKIGEDIYTYFLDTALHGENKNLSESQARKLAEGDIAYYVKINTEFEKRNLSLASSEKADIAAEVNSLWNIYGGYYSKIGVSKQTLTKVYESRAFEQALINSIYGSGGDTEIPEASRKDYFSKNYVFFKAINAYLCTVNEEGKTVPVSDEELNSIKNKFSSMKDSISAENTIDAVNVAYVESAGGSTESEMPVMSATSKTDTYPKNFFGDVSKLENDEVAVLTYTDYIFLVQKKNGTDLYSDYAADVLKDMASDDFSKYIDGEYKDIKVSGVDSVEKDCFSIIEKSR